MKGFASGVGGVCVCVLAIMGTILCGFVLGVDETATTKTEYSQVADTTGLFTTTTTPAFTDYNPAANWTGYKQNGGTGLGGVSYSSSTKINSYPIPQNYDEVYKVYFSPAGGTDYADPPGLWLGDWVGGRTIIISDDQVVMSKQTSYVLQPRVKTVAQILTAGMLTYEYLEIDLINKVGDVSVRAWAAPSSSWQLQTFNASSGSLANYVTWMMLPLEQTSKTVKLLVYPEQDIVIGYDEVGAERFRSTTADTTIAFQQTADQSQDDKVLFNKTTWAGVDIDPGMTFVYKGYQAADDKRYMDVSQGVVPTTTDKSTTWSNGYANGKIDMLIRWNPSATKTIFWMYQTIDFTDTSGAVQTMTLYIEIDYYYKHWGNDSIMIATSDMTENVGKNTKIAYLGNFARGLYVSFDMTNDALTVYGLESFRSFQDFTTLATPALTYTGLYTETAGRTAQTVEGGITCSGMILGTQDADTTAPTIGIVETSVYLGDTALVMADPTIQPGAIWTGTDPWELRIYSFAYYGSSVQIQDSTGTLASFDVTGETVTVDGTDHTLSNIYIRSVWDSAASEWIVYLVFGDERGDPIQVATTTDTDGPILNFGGYWYFASSYYSGEVVQSTDYTIDFQHFIFDSNAAILCFMGLLILGAIVAKRMAGLGIYDMIILLFAGVCGFVLMVV